MTINASEGVEKGEHLCIVAEIWIGAATMENGMEGPQKFKNKTTMWSSNATSVYLSEKKKENTKLKRYMHPHVYYGFPDSSVGKESVCSAGDPGSIPGYGRCPWGRDRLPTPVFLVFPYGSADKESACNVGDLALIPGLGRCPGERKGYPIQYSGPENSMDSIYMGP